MQTGFVTDEDTNLNLDDDTTEAFTVDASWNLIIAVSIVLFVPIILWMVWRYNQMWKQRQEGDPSKNYDFYIVIGTHEIKYWVCDQGQLVPVPEESLETV